MKYVQVRVHLAAPVESVFDAVSDHENFLRDKLTRTKVITDGTPSRNGLGCRREVSIGPGVRFVEEITAWDRPRSFEYVIRESSLPVEHRGGRLTFTPAGDGSDVEWTTRFRVPVPLLGSILGFVAQRIFTRAFAGLLQAAKSNLEPAHAA